MNEMTPQPPARRPQDSARRRSPARRTQPAESRLLGYIVLGIGIVAVLGVLLMALNERSGPAIKERTGDAQTAQELQADLSASPEAPVSAPQEKREAAPRMIAPPSAPVSQDRLYFKRQPSLAGADILGTWQTALGRYTAILQLQNGTYQIIIADPVLAKRTYSAGTYTKEEDILLLKPRLDWPDPGARGGARVPYEILTRAPFPVIAAMQQGRMLWQNPPQSESRVLVPYKMPLTMGENVDYIVWLKLN